MNAGKSDGVWVIVIVCFANSGHQLVRGIEKIMGRKRPAAKIPGYRSFWRLENRQKIPKLTSADWSAIRLYFFSNSSSLSKVGPLQDV